MTNLLMVEKFTKNSNAKCRISTKSDLTLQRRNVFFITVATICFKDTEVTVSLDGRSTGISLINENMKYVCNQRLQKNSFLNIWDTFGTDVVRNSFFPGISERCVKKIFTNLREQLIPLLNSFDLDGCDSDSLNLIQTLDSYKDFTFKKDINETITEAQKALYKIITRTI